MTPEHYKLAVGLIDGTAGLIILARFGVACYRIYCWKHGRMPKHFRRVW